MLARALVIAAAACLFPAAALSGSFKTVVVPGQVVPTFTFSGNDQIALQLGPNGAQQFSFVANSAIGSLQLIAADPDGGFAKFVLSINVPYEWANERSKTLFAAMVNSEVTTEDRSAILGRGGAVLNGTLSDQMLLNQESRLAFLQIKHEVPAIRSVNKDDIRIASYFLITSKEMVLNNFVEPDEDMQDVVNFITQNIDDADLFDDDLKAKDSRALEDFPTAHQHQIQLIVQYIQADLKNRRTHEDACGRLAGLNDFLGKLTPDEIADFDPKHESQVTVLSSLLNCIGAKLALNVRLSEEERGDQLTMADTVTGELSDALEAYRTSGSFAQSIVTQATVNIKTIGIAVNYWRSKLASVQG